MNPEIKSALLRILPFFVVIAVIFFRIKQRKLDPRELYLQQPNSPGNFFRWTIGFLIFILLVEFLLFKLGILEVQRWNHGLFSSILRIVGAVILAPIAEELIFRGIILNLLVKRKLNLHLAIFIQAIFFVLLHNFAYQNTLNSNIGIVQSLVDASLFGYAKYSTKSLYTPITMHITGNLVATLERFFI